MKYNLYAGLGGGFGGATYQYTDEYNTLDAAVLDAYDLAWEQYESYAGMHGLLSWNECKEELLELYETDEVPDDEVNEYYRDQVESWIVYYAVLADEDENMEEEDDD